MSKWYNHNEGGKALIIFEEDDLSKQLDTVSISMLVNNKIPCLVPVSFSQVDETRYLKFNISSRIAFREFLERPTTFGIVSELFINMCNSFIELRKYMIDGSALILNPDMMFIDASLSMASFILEPLLEEHRPVKYSDFFKKILFSLQITDNGNLGAVVNMLNGRNFSLENFSEQLINLKNASLSYDSPVSERDRDNRSENDFGEFADRQLNPEKTVEKPEPPKKPSDEGLLGLGKFAIPGIFGGSKQKDQKETQPQIPTPPPAPAQTPTGGAVPSVKPPKPEPPQKKPEKGGLFKKLLSGDKEKKAKPAPAPSAAPMGGIAIPGMEVDHIKSMGSMQPVPASAPVQPNIPNVQPENPVSPEPPAQEFIVPDYLEQTGGSTIEPPYSDSENMAGRIMRTYSIDDEDDTTQLMGGEEGSGIPRLMRLSTKEIIDIDKDTFNIGCDPKYLLDYVISDKRISRRHASIIHRNGNYFIVDLGSKNHTYVNGNMLISNMEQILNSGDKIRLAVEEFIFQL